MPIHHIIPRHEWRKRFGNFRGFNAPDNTIDLYTEQHGQVHLHYFNEITHIEFDRIAGLSILKQIGKDDIRKELGRIVGLSRMGVKQTPDHIIKAGRFRRGAKQSPEHIEMRASKLRGRKRTAIAILHSSEGHKGQKAHNKGKIESRVVCPHCSISGGANIMKRWHFDRCRHTCQILSRKSSSYLIK